MTDIKKWEERVAPAWVNQLRASGYGVVEAAMMHEISELRARIHADAKLIAEQNRLAKERQEWALHTNKIVRDLRAALADTQAPSAPVDREVPEGWQPLAGAGQVRKGDKLRFSIGDKSYCETAKLILNPGTDKEEVIYNIRQNFYFITSMVVGGASSHKGVEVLAADTLAKQIASAQAEVAAWPEGKLERVKLAGNK